MVRRGKRSEKILCITFSIRDRLQAGSPLRPCTCCSLLLTIATMRHDETPHRNLLAIISVMDKILSSRQERSLHAALHRWSRFRAHAQVADKHVRFHKICDFWLGLFTRAGDDAAIELNRTYRTSLFTDPPTILLSLSCPIGSPGTSRMRAP